MADAAIIDGRAFARRLEAEVHAQVAKLRAAGGVPGLAVVLVGDDPASAIYVRNKSRATASAGMQSFEHRLPADTPEAALLTLVRGLNADPKVHGILVQLPLPRRIRPFSVIEAIAPEKDVDGFHPTNAGRLAIGEDGFVPCTPQGCLILLKDRSRDLSGAEAVVVGRSTIVGRPMAALLVREDCTVTMAHSRTRDLRGHCRRADILVVAAGRPELVRGDWIKPGAMVLDVGMNRREIGDGRQHLVGDVCFAEAVKVAGAISPVPGGVGPMTIACLLRNTVIAFCRQNNRPVPKVEAVSVPNADAGSTVAP